MNAQPIAPPRVSIAVRAWNEEAVIRRTLESVFEQNIFEQLSLRGERAEVVCIPNGCTDDTAGIALGVFIEQKKRHPFAKSFSCRVQSIAQAGRNNTWNAYVHEIAHRQAEFLFIMDSDILFDRRETLFNMYMELVNHADAYVASDVQIKDIALKKKKSLLDRVSLATTAMTRQIKGQMTGQLYCIRSEIARRIWLPKELGAPDDGFIKAIVCSDFFTSDLEPGRIRVAPNASHIFEAYRSPFEVLNNQKRQMIGQTTVHLLVDHYLKNLPLEQRLDLASTIRQNDESDPDWLKRLISGHLRGRHFWQLFPDALTFRFNRWRKLKGFQRVTHFPAAMAGFVVTMVACFRAHRHFKRGQMHYWPKASRDNIRNIKISSACPAPPITEPAKN
ncbi:MAG TPA: glycosyltransferase family A protein [Desulfuromonadaceae bacterium]|nr:glycosyltransferase family A protein [Desulfuromonadaceae bacterium]